MSDRLTATDIQVMIERSPFHQLFRPQVLEAVDTVRSRPQAPRSERKSQAYLQRGAEWR